MVRPGYKQTEVGEIPEDWETRCIDSLGAGNIPPIKAGPFGSALTKNTYVKSGYKVYGQEQVIRGDHNYGNYFISSSKYRELESCAIKPGDILLSLVGTSGKLLVIPDNALPGVINPRLIRFSFDRNLISSFFFKELFESEWVQKYLDRYSQGGTMKILNASMLRPVSIPLPTIQEQKAIAKALSDVDDLIASLEKLIAKKRAIKTATMQQLLTGKKRLPGFGEGKGYKQTELGEIPEDWDVRPLSELLKIRHGKSQKEVSDPNGEYPILATGGEIGRASQPLYSKPSVLIGRKGTIDIPYYMDTPFWTVDTLFYSEISDDADAKFLFYKFCLIDWYQYNEASGVPSLNSATIERILQVIPSSKDEQSEIAEVITEFDNDLDALNIKLNKTKAIKQGMMQELLTGRTRLI